MLNIRYGILCSSFFTPRKTTV